MSEQDPPAPGSNGDDAGKQPDDSGKKPGASGDGSLIRGQVKHQQISARVPEKVTPGVFSTGAIVLMGGHEFILDFVLRMAQPHQIVARVVLPHPVLGQFIQALRTNLQRYRDRFGDPPALPKPEPGAKQPSIEDVYDDLKLPDDALGGVYANSVMVSHSPAEFCFDFIANFFPRSAVSARVYMSAPQVPRMLDALQNTADEYKRRVTAQRRHDAQIAEGEQLLREFQEKGAVRSRPSESVVDATPDAPPASPVEDTQQPASPPPGDNTDADADADAQADGDANDDKDSPKPSAEDPGVDRDPSRPEDDNPENPEIDDDKPGA